MDLREEILNTLVDDDESIVQIEKLLNLAEIHIERKELIAEICSLLTQEYIAINYPQEAQSSLKLNVAEIEDYWFGLTEKGLFEWKKIEWIE